MKCPLACVLAWLVLAAGIAQAVPARLPYESEEPDLPRELDLPGTIWQGKIFNGDAWVTFQPDGTLIYSTDRAQKDRSPGTWKLAGQLLYLEVNRFSEHRGVVKGNVIQGDSTNKAGARGQFRLHRATPGE